MNRQDAKNAKFKVEREEGADTLVWLATLAEDGSLPEDKPSVKVNKAP